MSLAVNHKINHKYPKLLSIPILNTMYENVCTPKATVNGILHPVEVESNEVSNISWTTTEQLQDRTKIAQKNSQQYHWNQASSQKTTNQKKKESIIVQNNPRR